MPKLFKEDKENSLTNLRGENKRENFVILIIRSLLGCGGERESIHAHY